VRVAVFVVVLGFGCGDNLRLPVGIHNGSTLVARSYVAGDASLFRSWHDTQTDVDCAFQVAADGRYRCLPMQSYAGYADPNCTKPNVTVMPCTDTPRFVIGPRRALAACPTDDGVGVYAVGAATPDQAYYYSDGTGCRLGTNGSGGELHALTEVPLAGFVAADLVHDGAGSIQSYAFHAEDGALQADSTWDTTRDAECSIYDDELRCRPTEIALHYDDLWTDDACTIHAAVDLSRVRPCARPNAVREYEPSTGEVVHSEIGAAIPVAYTGSAGACSVASALAGDVYYLEGARIPESQFPAETQVLDGTGRVRALRYEQTTGSPLASAHALYDTTFDEVCDPQPFVDGSTRCVPRSAPQGGGIYADSACSRPIAQVNPATHPRVFLAAHGDDTCGGVVRYESFAVGAPYTGALYANPHCQAYPRDPSMTYLTVGDAIELEELDEH
jgi:hypothetical protein